MIFGVIVAFLLLALVEVKVPTLRETSPILLEFLDSKDKSKNFSIEQIDGGIYHLMFKCAKDESIKKGESIAVPVSPILRLNGNDIEACIPFSVRTFDKNLSLGAFILLSLEDGKISMKSMKIGDARLPDFMAQKVANSLFDFYVSIKPLRKYLDIIESSKIQILPDNIIRIQK